MTVEQCLANWAQIECCGMRKAVLVRAKLGGDKIDFDRVVHNYVQLFIFTTGRRDGVFVARLLYGIPVRWDQRPIKSKLQSLIELGHGEMVLTPSSIITKQIAKDFCSCFEEWTKENPIPEYIEPRSEDFIPTEGEARYWGG